MTTTISQVYLGDLRVESHHGPSEMVISTDAPKDHAGLGRSFAPTDLLATALGSGALTAMAIAADKRGWETTGMSAITKKHISAELPRKVATVSIAISFPETIDEDQARLLKEIAYNNPVYLSVRDSLSVSFIWTDR